MDHLLRDVAPLSEAGWRAIDDEAKSQLTTYLAARKLVDFSGPKGWSHSATNLGRVASTSDTPWDGVTARQRKVVPLIELRSEFTVSRAEMEDVERGANDVDLSELGTAARRIALSENITVFHGYGGAATHGITEASSHEPVPFDGDFAHAPTTVARAVDVLQSGVGGPYGLAIGPAGYTGIIETTEHGGYPLLDHLRQILGGPVVWAPGVEGGVVLSLRGGDFVLESGQDLSIGYLDHDATTLRLYFEESLSFRVNEPDAAIPVHLTAS
jgi:uncharacterized linocin/CFP29 family protein